MQKGVNEQNCRVLLLFHFCIIPSHIIMKKGLTTEHFMQEAFVTGHRKRAHFTQNMNFEFLVSG